MNQNLPLTETEGKPSANVKSIPNIDNASDELKQLQVTKFRMIKMII